MKEVRLREVRFTQTSHKTSWQESLSCTCTSWANSQSLFFPLQQAELYCLLRFALPSVSLSQVLLLDSMQIKDVITDSNWRGVKWDHFFLIWNTSIFGPQLKTYVFIQLIPTEHLLDTTQLCLIPSLKPIKIVQNNFPNCFLKITHLQSFYIVSCKNHHFIFLKHNIYFLL